MLTLTENAATIIKGALLDTHDATDAGLRIAARDGDPSHCTVEIADAPHPSDEVVEDRGARVFLDPGASLRFADKELDAVIDTDRVRFSVRSQGY